MDPQFQEVADEITRNVIAAVTVAVNTHVTEVVTAAEKRLADQAAINVEAVKEVAKLAADGYAASLESIDRRLETIVTRVSGRLDDHDGILDNHNDRIKSLERRRPKV